MYETGTEALGGWDRRKIPDMEKKKKKRKRRVCQSIDIISAHTHTHSKLGLNLVEKHQQHLPFHKVFDFRAPAHMTGRSFYYFTSRCLSDLTTNVNQKS